MASATPFLDIQDVKLYAGITSSNQDEVLTAIMAGALPALENYCNRIFSTTTQVEYRDGNGAMGMMLAHYPVASIASVTIDGAAIPLSTSFTAPGYYFVPGGRRLILRGNTYRFTQGNRNVEIALTAGFGDGMGVGGTDLNPWPEDLRMAGKIYIINRLNERMRIGVGSKSLAGESISFNDNALRQEGMPVAVRTILANYMNTVPEYGA